MRNAVTTDPEHPSGSHLDHYPFALPGHPHTQLAGGGGGGGREGL